MYFENGFIKNEGLLQEKSNVNDLLNRDSEILKYSNRIDELHGSTIRGIVGQFGIGKSTLINNVKIYRDNYKYDERWFEFDARKYPDRKDLWEGFVLDFAKQVDEKEFNEARKKIDGIKYEKTKSAVSALGSALSAFGYVGTGGVVSSISDFFNSSPAKRVFQIQEIFQKLVSKVNNRKIIIVVEDIDRSLDAGIFFLETLKQFISKNNFGKEILIIMPLGTGEYYEHLDSYLKPIDYFDFFNPGTPNLENFIKEIFIDDIGDNINYFGPLREFLEGLFVVYPKDITLRKLKLVIRKANQNHMMMIGKYNKYFNLDWRVNIIYEIMKYVGFNDEKISLFDQLKNDGDFHSIDRKSLIGAYLYNLVGFTSWGKDTWYIGSTASLYEDQYDEGLRRMKKVLKTSISLPIKFYREAIGNEIVGSLHVQKGFDKEEVSIAVPSQYFDY